MTETPMSGGGFVVPEYIREYFSSPDFLRGLFGLGPDTRTPEQRAADEAAQAAAAAATRAEIERVHAEIMASATGLRRAVLERHGPHLSDWELDTRPTCQSCDWAGYDGEASDFPCSTYELARDWAEEPPRPTLAERQARYLEVRQHTLSTAGIITLGRFDAQARYVRGEAVELWTAVCDYVDALNQAQFETNPEAFVVDELQHVRHEIADVTLATATLAGMLPGDVTIEACIDEKTEHDRGRG